MAVGGITGDTIYIIHENLISNKLFGNSWYTGVAYNLSKSHELSLNFGRTYGSSFVSGGGFNFNMKSWGLGYSYYKMDQISGQTVSAFGEISNFFLPPATARMDYIFDFTKSSHYLRPSIGMNLFAFDIMYSYTFRIHGDKNNFKHGLIGRFKYYINNKNWQKNYPRMKSYR